MSSTRHIDEVLEIVLKKRLLDDLSIVRLSMTNREIREEVSETLLDNMLSTGLLNSEVLANVFLFPYLREGKHYQEAIFKLALTNIGFLTAKAVYDLEIIEEIINVIVKSDYDNRAHFFSVCSNVCFFGNKPVLELLSEGGIILPASLDKKVKSKLLEEVDAGRSESAERYLKTYEFFIEKKLESVLKEILATIKNHKAVLNGGGDTSITEIDHPIPRRAAKIYKIVKNALNSGDSLIEEYRSVSDLIFKKISSRKSMSFVGYGNRDTTTTQLYTRIMSCLSSGDQLMNDLVLMQNNLNKLLVPKKVKSTTLTPALSRNH